MKHQFRERVLCPACGCSSAKELFNSRFDSFPISDYIELYYGANRITELADWIYRLDRCQNCELVFQRYIGNESFLSELYSSWLSTADHQAEAHATSSYLLKAPYATRDGHELMWAAKHLGKPLVTMQTLDYGMGWALWARIAKEIGCESFGFDLSTVRMRAAAQQGIKVLQSEIFPAESFDFINTEQVFEHVADPLALAVKLSKSLRPGGILKVSVPNGTDIIERLKIGNWDAARGTKQSLDPVAPLEHVNCLNEKTLIQMGMAANLIPISKNTLAQFAFLSYKKAINLASPKETLKAFIRPWYRFHNRQSLYIWLQRTT